MLGRSGPRAPTASTGAGLGALMRACHPEPTLAVTTMAVALAASSGRSAWGTIAAGAAVLAGQLTVGWDNDWLDAERDARAGRADKPVARGEITRATVGTAAVIAGVATVALSLLSGWQAGLAHVGAVLMALAYNARLKANLASFVPYAVAFPLLIAFIALGRYPSHWPPWWALVGAALLGTGAHLANAAPDVAEDVAAGIRGLPQRLGPRRSILGALTLMVASTAVIVVGIGSPGRASVAKGALLAVLVVLALVPVLALLARRPGRGPGRGRRPAPLWGRRAWFRAAMVVALANVALLVARGASL